MKKRRTARKNVKNQTGRLGEDEKAERFSTLRSRRKLQALRQRASRNNTGVIAGAVSSCPPPSDSLVTMTSGERRPTSGETRSNAFVVESRLSTDDEPDRPWRTPGTWKYRIPQLTQPARARSSNRSMKANYVKNQADSALKSGNARDAYIK